jgi:hypothetical protein
MFCPTYTMTRLVEHSAASALTLVALALIAIAIDRFAALLARKGGSVWTVRLLHMAAVSLLCLDLAHLLLTSALNAFNGLRCLA